MIADESEKSERITDVLAGWSNKITLYVFCSWIQIYMYLHKLITVETGGDQEGDFVLEDFLQE